MKKLLKAIWKAISTPFKWIANEILGLVGLINFWNKRREAMKKWKVTGRRHFVLPAENNKLAVVDNLIIKAYNKRMKKEGKPMINHNTILETAYFSTPVGTMGGGKKRKLSFKNPK